MSQSLTAMSPLLQLLLLLLLRAALAVRLAIYCCAPKRLAGLFLLIRLLVFELLAYWGRQALSREKMTLVLAVVALAPMAFEQRLLQLWLAIATRLSTFEPVRRCWTKPVVSQIQGLISHFEVAKGQNMQMSTDLVSLVIEPTKPTVGPAATVQTQPIQKQQFVIVNRPATGGLPSTVHPYGSPAAKRLNSKQAFSVLVEPTLALHDRAIQKKQLAESLESTISQKNILERAECFISSRRTEERQPFLFLKNRINCSELLQVNKKLRTFRHVQLQLQGRHKLRLFDMEQAIEETIIVAEAKRLDQMTGASVLGAEGERRLFGFQSLLDRECFVEWAES